MRPRAKEPLTDPELGLLHGVHDATSDLDKIRTYWQKHPDANIGLPTGTTNNLAIIDVDPRNGGQDEGFPDTVVVETGNGIHRYYRIDTELRGTILRQGVDLKGEGGYVVAPPSIHENGKVYKRRGGVVKMQPFPLSLVQPKQPTPLPFVAPGTDEPVPEGGRNTHLISIGGALRAKGCGYGVILSTLQAENYARCRPPLPEQEVARIALSATRYHEGPKLQLVQASTVVKEEVKWIWQDRIPAGKISLLEGDPGLGKSTLAALLVAAVTAGRALPLSATTIVGRAIVASAEDGYGDTLVPRLEAAGADLSRVLFLAGLDLSKARHATALEQEIGSDVKLIVIDPLMAYLGSTNSYSDQSIREVMSRCHNIATRSGVAFLFIRHWNKHEDSSLMYRGGGSIGITGAARSVLAVISDDSPGSTLRILKRVKGNLSRQPEDLTYELVGDPPRILWHGIES